MSLFLNCIKAPFSLKKPAPKPEGVLLRAALFSDTHITKARYRRMLFVPTLKRLARFNADLVLFAGDCTDNGNEANWRAFTADVLKHCPVKNVIAAMGNHDTWESYDASHDYVSAKERYLRHAEELSGERYANVYYEKEVNGVPFFILGSEGTGVGSTLGAAQLSWLENALRTAVEKRPAGPLIVAHHSPMNHTHGVGENEQGMGIEGDMSPLLLSVLDRYKNVIYLCGHTHFGLQYGGKHETIQRVGENVTSICLPSFEYGEIFNGKYASPGFPLIGTGLVMDVYQDCVVFTGESFLRGKELPWFTYTVKIF